MLFRVTSWALLSAFTQQRLTDVHCVLNSQKANKRLLSLRVPSLPLSHSIVGQRTKRGVWRRDFRRWKQRFVSLKLLLKENYVGNKKDRTINASNLIKTKAEQFVRKHLMPSLFPYLIITMWNLIYRFVMSSTDVLCNLVWRSIAAEKNFSWLTIVLCNWLGTRRDGVICQFRKTRIKVIGLANHKGHRHNSETVITCTWLEARENACEWVTILVFWLDEKVARVFSSQSCSVVEAKPITFRY